MCTASVYKGRVALLAQASGPHARGVVEHVLEDLVDTGLADPTRRWHPRQGVGKGVAVRPEMEEIAATQEEAGLTPDLFLAVARVYEDSPGARSRRAPEGVTDDLRLSDVLERLSAGGAGRDVGKGRDEPRDGIGRPAGVLSGVRADERSPDHGTARPAKRLGRDELQPARRSRAA